MVISFAGEVDDDIKFDYAYNLPTPNTHGNGGCPATINGEFFFFGGWHNKVSLFYKREIFYNTGGSFFP